MAIADLKQSLVVEEKRRLEERFFLFSRATYAGNKATAAASLAHAYAVVLRDANTFILTSKELPKTVGELCPRANSNFDSDKHSSKATKFGGLVTSFIANLHNLVGIFEELRETSENIDNKFNERRAKEHFEDPPSWGELSLISSRISTLVMGTGTKPGMAADLSALISMSQEFEEQVQACKGDLLGTNGPNTTLQRTGKDADR